MEDKKHPPETLAKTKTTTGGACELFTPGTLSPCTLVIFGASGDLTRRKLIPALARLDAEPRLPGGFSVLGVSRSPMTDESFRAHLAQDLSGDLRQSFDRIAHRVFYHAADTSEPGAMDALSDRLDALLRLDAELEHVDVLPAEADARAAGSKAIGARSWTKGIRGERRRAVRTWRWRKPGDWRLAASFGKKGLK